MNLQQLRIVRETARRQFNLTEVANALFTAQSGICAQTQCAANICVRPSDSKLSF